MARQVRSRSAGYTILVVDDQDETLVSTRRLLEREGHRVLTAASASEALALYKKHNVHLVLADYVMPEMDGADLVRAVRAVDPLAQIILQTAYADDHLPRDILATLDIQGYHNKADGPVDLLVWVDAGLKAYRVVHGLRTRVGMQADLVTNVSHELRTPLCVISGYSELLREGAFGRMPVATTPPLEAVEYATRGLGDLFSDFLLFAKAEAGALDVSCRWIAMQALIDELTNVATTLVRDRPLHFRVLADHAPEGLVTDPVELQAILRNLLANAVKFTRQGAVELRITADGGRVRFVVSDTGVGIRPEHLESIFEPFRQLDASWTRAYPGLGLGLALSRRLAHLLGGALEVVSQVGVGSTFTLSLPILAREVSQSPAAGCAA